MKNFQKLRIIALAAITTLCFACSGTRYPNTGTASDRTGTNGATNGNGKVPTDNTHNYRY